MSVLVYGGLFGAGFQLTKQLLNEGLNVVALSAATASKETADEEENELSVGRHALLTPVYQLKPASEVEPEDIEHIFIMDERFFEKSSSLDDRSNRLQNMLDSWLPAADTCRRVTVLSHLDIYGDVTGIVDEKTLANPVSPEGVAADKLEEITIRTALNHKNDSKVETITIFRTAESGRFDGDNAAINTAASFPWVQAFIGAIRLDDKGVNIYNLSDGQKRLKNGNDVFYNNDKAISKGLL